MIYQKDGPGLLKRAYLDRIFAPKKITRLEHVALLEVPLLKCMTCKRVVGVPYVYPKERRKAYLIEQGSISKKLLKNV